MLPQLQTPFDALVQCRQALIKRLDAMSEAQHTFKPAPDSWSILETVHHMILVERGPYVITAKKLGQPAKPVRWLNHLRYRAVMLLLDTPLKIKVPAKVAKYIISDGQIGYEGLKQQWINQHEKWKTLLERVEPAHLKATYFIHPLAGPITTAMTLGFIKHHTDHHLKQINRIEQVPSFPR